MDESWKALFENVIAEAETLKKDALNRHDPVFDPWHRRARSVLLSHAPIKIPAFDEIRFASDFFLSKPGEEQLDINDRIALACDLDLAVELFQQALALVEDELKFKKSRDRIHSVKTEFNAPVEAPPSAAPPTGEELRSLKSLIENLGLNPREQEEVLEELERVEQALATQPPDWDRIKRTVKYLLDFDRTLALAAVPVILKRCQSLYPGP